jgi:integrase
MTRKGRRRKGEGAVYQRASDGLWVGMLDLGIIAGQRRRKTVYGQTERETIEKLSTLRTAHDRGIDLLAPTLTVGQWLDVWLSDIKGFDGTRPRTLTLYQGLAERYVKPVIGGVRLDKLTPAHVQRLVTETRNGQTARGTPPSASTLRHVYKLIRNALGDAYRMELVTRNVATQVKAPPLDRHRRVGLDVAEALRLFDVINGERLEALYVLALTTGLRRGELLALRWDDIDLGSRQLHVRRALQRVDGKLQVAEPKTSSSRRTVVLPRLAVRHLQEHKKRQDAERQALGKAWRDHGLVFASSIGTPVEPRNVNRRWDELRRRAGLDWLRLHDLRHGCATLLLGKGVPDRVIMEVLGHAEIGVTMNTYAHVLPVLRQEAADAIDELFGA